MPNQITPQLNTEIQKLKEQDYTSYQKFYAETSSYLYGIIWNIVQDKTTADSLIGELYNDIYKTIAIELRDNTTFYEWAGNKARSMSDTYVATHVTSGNVGNQDNLDKELATFAAVNTGGHLVEGTAGITGIAGTGEVGVGGTVAGFGSAGVGGMTSASSLSVAVGSAGATGAASAGVGTTAVAGVIAKAGLSIGAKIAIAIASTAVVVGGSVGIYAMTTKDKDKEKTTTEITTEMTIEIETTTEKMTTEAITEEVTEEEVDPLVERYNAYYSVIEEYMEKYPTTVSCNENIGIIGGLADVRLVDFSGDGNEQLVLIYRGEDDDDLGYTFYADIYDYEKGSAVLKGSLTTYGRHFDICFGFKYNVDDKVELCVHYNSTEIMGIEGEDTDKIYMYDNGEIIQIHEYREVYLDDGKLIYSIDGNEVEEDVFYDMRRNDMADMEDCILGEVHVQSVTLADIESSLIVVETILKKHETIRKIAQTIGSDLYQNSEDTVLFILDEDSIKSDGEYHSATTNKNQFNEEFWINSSEGIELSKDEKTVHLTITALSLEYYVACIDDVIIDKIHACEDHNRYCMSNVEDSAQGKISDTEITKEEYDALAEELMNR